MSKIIEYRDVVAYHPGAYVEEVLDELNAGVAEFAKRVDLEEALVQHIIDGTTDVDMHSAENLSKLTGVSIRTWLNLQAKFDSKKNEIETMRSEDEREVAKLADWGALKDNGIVEPKRRTMAEKMSTLRQVFNVANLSVFREMNASVSYRQSNHEDMSAKAIINANLLLELALNNSRSTTDVPYNADALKSVLPELKKLTVGNLDEVYPTLKQLLLKCGIVVVGLPKFSGAKLSGATHRFEDGVVMVMVTDYQKREDSFWFSFMHEIGHVVNDDFNSNFSDEESYEEKENKANEFAANFLIPKELYVSFVRDDDFSVDTVTAFAERIGVSPAIVVGRLQNDPNVPSVGYTSPLQYLIKRYSIKIN